MRKNLIEARGSSAIPLTPYLDNEEIDIQTLEKEIDFFCNAKVGSICGPVNVTEFMVLTEKERKLMIEVPVKVASGRTCFIANVASPNIQTAVEYTEFAEKIGADAVIAMPPYVGEVDFGGVKKYFEAISKATSLPIMIQNMAFPNISISPDNIIELCEMAPNISWVKQEVPPAPLGVAEINAKRNAALEGIMSGFGGLYSVQDFENGAIATIHAGEFADVMQRIWDLMFAGKMDEARRLHALLMPGLQMENIYTWQFCKYIMMKRGIFKNYSVRNRCKPLSAAVLKEFDSIWEHISQLL